jgi:hypothetical protein
MSGLRNSVESVRNGQEPVRMTPVLSAVHGELETFFATTGLPTARKFLGLNEKIVGEGQFLGFTRQGEVDGKRVSLRAVLKTYAHGIPAYGIGLAEGKDRVTVSVNGRVVGRNSLGRFASMEEVLAAKKRLQAFSGSPRSQNG